MDRKTHRQLYREFLSKLIEARKSAKLNQSEAARLLGKHQSYISKCESGERRIDIVELQIFATIYGKPIDFFEVTIPNLDISISHHSSNKDNNNTQ